MPPGLRKGLKFRLAGQQSRSQPTATDRPGTDIEPDGHRCRLDRHDNPQEKPFGVFLIPRLIRLSGDRLSAKVRILRGHRIRTLVPPKMPLKGARSINGDREDTSG